MLGCVLLCVAPHLTSPLCSIGETNAYLARKLEFHVLKSEETLLKRGAALDSIYVLVSGSLRLHDFEEGDAGEEEALGVGDFFGEECIVSAGATARYSASATEPAVVLSIEEAVLNKVFVANNNTEKMAELRVGVSREHSSLEDLMRFPRSCQAFESYLRSTHALESLQFWLAVDKYEAKATFIYQGGELSKTILHSASSGHGRSQRHNSATSAARVAPVVVPAVPSTVEEENSRLVTSARSLRVSAASADEPSVSYREKSPPRKRMSVVTSSVVYDLAEDIMRRFIYIDSPLQINISGQLRSAVEDRFKRWGACNSSLAVYSSAVLNNGSILVNATESTKSLYQPGNLLGDDSDEGFIELFSAAKKEVYELLRRDKFAKWRETPEFMSFFQSLPEHRRASGAAPSISFGRKTKLYNAAR